MARLSPGVKRFIVRCLAGGLTPSEVVQVVWARLGVRVTRQGVAFYDPTTAAGSDRLSSEWTDLYWAERQKHLDEIDGIPIAHTAYRLNQLQSMYDQLLEDAYPLKLHQLGPLLSILKQAAKEAGYFFGKSTQGYSAPPSSERFGIYVIEPPDMEAAAGMPVNLALAQSGREQ